jgi:cellulose synthase/poly-beta-1,6-N-acetylglucosamine synthase-like glycosyltransferase
MNFNGSGGVWRRQAIDDAGGWQADTLTEDLDLSYRAQLRGWRLQFVPHVVCPAELPVQMSGVKSQQHRWAKGSIQTAKKLLPHVLQADLPRFTKCQAVLHLTNYLVHPLMLWTALMMPWLPQDTPVRVVHTPLLTTISLVYAIVTNGVSLLQTKLSHREGYKASRVGLEAMPLDQHVKRRHGEREAGLEVLPAPVHDLFEMADERQH